MKLIFGLGNPGSKYSETRHNAGRRVVETIAAARRVSFKTEKKLQASFVSFDWENMPVTLAWSETYMNVSGPVIARLAQHLGVETSKDLLVVLDEAALPLGRLRIRPNGTDGGHNGLKSLALALGNQDYARLRFGIAPETPLNVPLEEYVLQPFAPEEKEKVSGALEKAAEACRLWVKGPIEQVMNVVNPSGI